MKSPQAFRSIGEVARLVGVATHVLRYWETQFPALAPVRRPDGRRYYRPDDLLLAAGLCEVMREDGLTIRGARRLIDMDKGAALRERGRLRLQTALEVPTDNGKAASRRRMNGGRRKSSDEEAGAQADHQGLIKEAASANDRRMTGQPEAGPANQSSAADAPAEEAHAAPATSDGAQWLARLTTTATALRGCSAEFPAAVRPLAQALRAAHQRRS